MKALGLGAPFKREIDPEAFDNPFAKNAAVLERLPEIERSTGLPATRPNLTPEERYARFKYAFSLGLPDVAEIPRERIGRIASIWGGGYSIVKTLPETRRRLKLSKGIRLFALNKTHDWLARKGLTPHFGVLADPRPWVADYMTPQKGVDYLFSSKLDPKIFERFLKAKASIYLWHPVETADGVSDATHLAKNYSNHTRTLVVGYSTVGQRTVEMILHLKPEAIELNGFDSCYDRDHDKLYPYSKPNSFSGVLEIDRNDMTIKRGDHAFRFLSNTMMRRQVEEFAQLMQSVGERMEQGKIKPTPIYVNGTGAIPWMAWRAGHHMNPEMMQKLHGDARTVDWRPRSFVEAERAA